MAFCNPDSQNTGTFREEETTKEDTCKRERKYRAQLGLQAYI